MVGVVASGLADISIRDILAGESFALSRNEVALGGAVSPGSRPQLSEHQKCG